MKLIGKILALPFIAVLTLLVAALSFILGFSGWLLSAAATLLGALGVLTLIMGNGTAAGIAALVMAFLISPFGLPAVADWFNHLRFIFKDGGTVERIWADRSRRESWTPEMKEKARQRALARRGE